MAWGICSDSVAVGRQICMRSEKGGRGGYVREGGQGGRIRVWKRAFGEQRGGPNVWEAKSGG
eukprot:2648560-Pyramimonas_sp.AAC.1